MRCMLQQGLPTLKPSTVLLGLLSVSAAAEADASSSAMMAGLSSLLAYACSVAGVCQPLVMVSSCLLSLRTNMHTSGCDVRGCTACLSCCSGRA